MPEKIVGNQAIMAIGGAESGGIATFIAIQSVIQLFGSRRKAGISVGMMPG